MQASPKEEALTQKPDLPLTWAPHQHKPKHGRFNFKQLDLAGSTYLVSRDPLRSCSFARAFCICCQIDLFHEPGWYGLVM